MVKHTPGPWEAYFSVHGDPSVCTDANRPAFTKVCDVSTSPSDYGQANCRLIAAAPALLESVEAFIECWTAGEFFINGAVIMAKLRAAAAKAHEGECHQSFDCNAGDHSDACPSK